MKLIINESPKPAITARIVSEVAAPRPETKPDNLPLPKVRCIHIIPIGPNGTEDKNPSKMPFIRSSSKVTIINYKIKMLPVAFLKSYKMS